MLAAFLDSGLRQLQVTHPCYGSGEAEVGAVTTNFAAEGVGGTSQLQGCMCAVVI